MNSWERRSCAVPTISSAPEPITDMNTSLLPTAFATLLVSARQSPTAITTELVRIPTAPAALKSAPPKPSPPS